MMYSPSMRSMQDRYVRDVSGADVNMFCADGSRFSQIGTGMPIHHQPQPPMQLPLLHEIYVQPEDGSSEIEGKAPVSSRLFWNG